MLGRLPETTAAGNPAVLLVVLELNAGARTPASVYWTACLVCGRFQMWSHYVAQAGLKVTMHPRQVSESFCLLLPSARPVAVHQHAQATGKFLQSRAERFITGRQEDVTFRMKFVPATLTE